MNKKWQVYNVNEAQVEEIINNKGNGSNGP